MSDLDPGTLRCVVRIAAGESVRAVARAVHLSQPALTARLQRLEQQLGFAVFARERGRVRLSARGRRLLPHLQRYLDNTGALQLAAQRIARDAHDELRLGMTPLAALSCGVPVVQALQQRHPASELALFEQASNELERMLAANEIDLALLHPPIGSEGIEIVHLFDERYVAVLPAGHRLAVSDVVSVTDLAGEDFAMVRREVGPAAFDRLVELCRRAGVQPKIRFHLPTSLTLQQFVVRTGCVGFAVESIQRWLMPGVFARPLKEATPGLPFALARRAGDFVAAFDDVVEAARRSSSAAVQKDAPVR